MLESSIEQTKMVSAEFPRDLLPLLRCSRDGGPLELAAELRCGAVGSTYGDARPDHLLKQARRIQLRATGRGEEVRTVAVVR
jgi:hypothetical protein